MTGKKSYKKLIGIILLMAGILLLPLLYASEPYRLSILIYILLNIVFATSMRTIMMTNQVTLGHAAFGAIGGYTAALLVTKAGFSFWLSLPLAAVVAVFFSLVIGYPTLRLKGAYFAILTFALSEVVRFVFQTWRSLFGGSYGIVDLPSPEAISIPGLFTIDFSSRISFYYLIAVFTIVVLAFLYRLEKSRFGLIFRSIGEADLLTEHTGANIINYKVLAFTIGSVIAALAGVLQTFYTGLINPMSFTFHQTVHYLIFIVIGGAGFFSGPILGAVILTALPEILKPLKEYEPIIYALVLVFGILFFPRGLMGMNDNGRLSEKIKSLFKRTENSDHS